MKYGTKYRSDRGLLLYHQNPLNLPLDLSIYTRFSKPASRLARLPPKKFIHLSPLALIHRSMVRNVQRLSFPKTSSPLQRPKSFSVVRRVTSRRHGSVLVHEAGATQRVTASKRSLETSWERHQLDRHGTSTWQRRERAHLRRTSQGHQPPRLDHSDETVCGTRQFQKSCHCPVRLRSTVVLG